MPWTFAHPAAVLPLLRLPARWRSLPALVLGAMLPDLGYYLGLLDWATFCHTPQGVLSACLPVGLVLLVVLQHFRELLTQLLPQPHRAIVRAQLAPPLQPALQRLGVAAAGLLVGAATHLVWDGFTHAGRWGVALLPVLNEPVFRALDTQFRLFNLLQHASTLVGLTAMAVAYRRTLREVDASAWPPREVQRRRWLLALLASAVSIGILLAWVSTPLASPIYRSQLIVRTIVCSTSLFALLWVVGSLLWLRTRSDA